MPLTIPNWVAYLGIELYDGVVAFCVESNHPYLSKASESAIHEFIAVEIGREGLDKNARVGLVQVVRCHRVWLCGLLRSTLRLFDRLGLG